jgi:hypothetical protein
MLKLIRRFLWWLQGETLKLLTLAVLLLLAWGVFAPVGTLMWWFNQGSETLGFRRQPPKKLLDRTTAPQNPSSIDCYIVFLPGVGDFSADQLTPGEEFFLNRLVSSYPNCVAVSGVFPYSAANESLGGRRLLAPLWQAVERADGWLKNADVVIKIRNLWRFAISADERYGPVYNQGIANAIVDRMNAVHPIPTNRRQPLRIVLIGTSGGAQIALGAVPYLDEWLNSEITVLSIGGAFDGETGFDAAKQVYHLKGRQDWIENMGHVFPSRWGWTVGSPFNRAQREGRYTIRVTGPHEHDGDNGYFGQNLVGKSRTTYVELTLETVKQLPIWSAKHRIATGSDDRQQL